MRTKTRQLATKRLRRLRQSSAPCDRFRSDDGNMAPPLLTTKRRGPRRALLDENDINVQRTGNNDESDVETTPTSSKKSSDQTAHPNVLILSAFLSRLRIHTNLLSI